MLVTTLLADTLAVLLALGSLTFYIAAFFYPEVHRRSDFVWGGLGFAYALVLWVGAGQMTWVVLLGQLVAVVLLLGLGWQTLTVRREKTPVYQQTPISLTPEVVGDWAKSQLNQLRIAPVDAVPVRLEKRASGSPRQDPRRRPAYEYEFVEDGLLDALEELPADVPAASSAEMSPSVPPSVDAEIISVEAPKTDEIPEAVVVEPETKESNDVVDGGQDSSAVEPESTSAPEPEESTSTPEPEPIAESALEDPISGPTPESNSEPALESVPLVVSEDDVQVEAATVTSSAEQDDDDWGDDFFEDDSEDNNWAENNWSEVEAPAASVQDARFSRESKTSSEPSPARVIERSPEKVPERKAEKKVERAVDKTREKPSLLATPVILAGWVKDVVASLTRPKPSKPMIEIPRREPTRSQPASPPPAASPPGAYATSQSVTSQSVTSQSVESAAERTVESSVERSVERATERTADRDAYQDDRAEPMADFSTDDTDDTDWEESNWDD